MKVQKLHLQGFKSFKDRTSIDFDEKITGIIGPNGCGKSNIVDALFWVMGEQSAKHLRGSQMQDVIFSGSSQHGSASFAEVSLSLKNTEHKAIILGTKSFIPEDIEVSRKLYKNGESEYRINNSLCRLKDIQELFLGTGAGAKSYSIIAQGEIEKLISSKPHERKEMFEEVAGISKYKIKKKESEKKIELARLNLKEIASLSKELKKSHEKLLEESSLAKKALSIQKMIEEEKVSSIYKEITSLLNELDSLEASSTSEELENLNIKRSELSLLLEKEKQQEDVLKKNFEDISKEYSLKKSLIFKLEEEKELYKKTTEEKKIFLNHLNEKITIFLAEFKKKEEALNNFTFSTSEEIPFLEKEKEKIALEINLYKEDQKSFSEEFISLKKSIEDYKNKKNITEKSLQTKTIFLGEKSLYLESIKKDLNTDFLIKDFTEDRKELTLLKKDLLLKKEELFKEKNIFNEIQKKIYSLEKIKEEQLFTLKKKEIEFEQKKNITVKDSHFFSSQPLFAQKDFTHPETILLQDILISSLEQEIYEDKNTSFLYSSSSSSSIDNLIPIPEWSSFYISEALTSENYKSYISKKYTRIISSNGKILIKHLSNDTFQIFIFNKPLNSFTQEISQRKSLDLEIISLKESIAQTNIEIISSNTALNQKKTIQLEEQVRILERSILEKDYFLQQKDEEHKKLLLKKESLEKREKEISNEIASFSKEITNLKEDITFAENFLQENTQRFLELEEKNTSLDKKILFLEGSLKTIEKEIFHLNKQQSQQKEYYNALKNELSELNHKHAQELSFIEDQKKSIQDIFEKIEIITSSTFIKKQENLEFEKNVKEKEKYLQESLTKRNHIEIDLKELEKNIHSLDKNFLENSLRKKFLLESEKKLSLQFFDLFHKNLRLSLKELYSQHTFEDIEIGTEIYPIDASFLQKSSSKTLPQLEKELSSLGNINWNAPSEIEKVKARFDFLTSEEKILENSLNDLEQAIATLDIKSHERFLTIFEEVSMRFKKVFPLVFNGGEASLELSMEDGTEGIQIFARPPGKKMQNIRLMSGGEKALTAISLIFSIFLVKPSPFCLLDEVDAPLDDANVARFNELLREMSSQTQFIVVTHNKKTMEINNKLYGITMQEPGVSKAVWVNLQ